MHEPFFADVKIASAGAAAPIIGLALGNIVLKRVNAGEAALFERLHFVIDAALFVIQRLQLAAAIVNNSNGGSEAEFNRALADRQRVLGMRNSASHDRVDIHVKIGVLGQQLQFLVENLQALLRDFVGIHVVDGNLQPLESGAIE